MDERSFKLVAAALVAGSLCGLVRPADSRHPPGGSQPSWPRVRSEPSAGHRPAALPSVRSAGLAAG